MAIREVTVDPQTGERKSRFLPGYKSNEEKRLERNPKPLKNKQEDTKMASKAKAKVAPKKQPQVKKPKADVITPSVKIHVMGMKNGSYSKLLEDSAGAIDGLTRLVEKASKVRSDNGKIEITISVRSK